MHYLEPIDCQSPDFGDFYDELPLWSARFGLMSGVFAVTP